MGIVPRGDNVIMKRVRLIVLTVLVLFVMPLVVNAEPLESFAENPIPHWVDDSDNVDLTWDSTAQTVDIGWPNDSIYWEDMTVVTDWVEYADSWESGESISTDGDIGTFACEGDAVNDVDGMITATTSVFAPLLKIRYKMESLLADKFTLHLVWAASSAFYTLTESTTWITQIITVDEWSISLVFPLTSIVINGRCDDTVDVDIEIEYIRIWNPLADLDISIPLNPQDVQSIELMGNFSALNSTVRFQMYDNDTASGLFYDVNSTQVTFPDSTYAKFTDFARINFSLDEQRIIFRIYVSAQNMTLINSYSSYVGLANNDYFRMNDTEFEGAYTLWYLQGDLGYLEEVIDTDNIFYQLFLSTELWGYFGPVGLVVIGFLLTKKEKALGIFMIIVESLLIAQYLALIEATPEYWWHVIILLLGVVQCAIVLIDR